MCIYMYRWIWIYGRRAWQPTIVFLPGESHGQRSLAGYPSVWGYKELDKPESHTHIYIHTPHLWGFPGGISGKEPTCQCRRHKRLGFSPWVGKIPWRRAWQPTPVFLLGESHGQRSLAGYSPWGHEELDMTEAS